MEVEVVIYSGYGGCLASSTNRINTFYRESEKLKLGYSKLSIDTLLSLYLEL